MWWSTLTKRRKRQDSLYACLIFFLVYSNPNLTTILVRRRKYTKRVGEGIYAEWICVCVCVGVFTMYRSRIFTLTPPYCYLIFHNREAPEALWRPEYGRYMLESTPGLPYGATFRDLVKVETDMKGRRVLARRAMHPGDIPLTLVNYPRLGCPDELIPSHEPDGKACQSMFVPDEIINPHARFP